MNTISMLGKNYYKTFFIKIAVKINKELNLSLRTYFRI